MKRVQVTNLIGAARAEADEEMLKAAFVETADYHGLCNTTDFNFVVGRRGTGKTALFLKVSEHFKNYKTGSFLIHERLNDYDAAEMYSFFKKFNISEYSSVRMISRITWRLHILLRVLIKLLAYYKIEKFEEYEYLFEFRKTHADICMSDSTQSCAQIIESSHDPSRSPHELPATIARKYSIETLQTSIRNILRETNHNVVFLFDGLDEGWNPDAISTSIVGGLAITASDLADNQTNIHTILFIRDNILRSLSHFDPDFSRHIEGAILRLRWTENSLLHLIANRLRKVLNLANVDSDVKLWNRFAQRGLKDREGFKKCLSYTLYRPRDIIVLLNDAYQLATRDGRTEIIEDDIESTSKEISNSRLEDLKKEYDHIFSGLGLLIQSFIGGPAFYTIGEINKKLDELIKNSDFSIPGSGDFEILGQGKEAFYALYSIGFVGIEDQKSDNIVFCHDGSQFNLAQTLDSSNRVCIHPCYWKSLDIIPDNIPRLSLEPVSEDYGKIANSGSELQDIRTKHIGQLIAELPTGQGSETAGVFEEWVLRAIKILFHSKLTNPELHANKDAIQRRDIVATNLAKDGFWCRVREDYASRQVIFEVKNYSALRLEDYRQAVSYCTGEYGKFVIIVNKSESEALSDYERDWVKEMHDTKDVTIFVLTARILTRCISKLRKTDRYDYTEDLLNKRLDTFTRRYFSLRH